MCSVLQLCFQYVLLNWKPILLHSVKYVVVIHVIQLLATIILSDIDTWFQFSDGHQCTIEINFIKITAHKCITVQTNFDICHIILLTALFYINYLYNMYNNIISKYVDLLFHSTASSIGLFFTRRRVFFLGHYNLHVPRSLLSKTSLNDTNQRIRNNVLYPYCTASTVIQLKFMYQKYPVSILNLKNNHTILKMMLFSSIDWLKT